MTNSQLAKTIRANIIGVETVGRNAAGNVVVRRGFFYRDGRDAAHFATRIVGEAQKLIDAKDTIVVVGMGEVWKPFRGGASVKASSHWWVELSIK